MQMEIWCDKLELAVLFIFYGKLVGLNRLVVQDLEVKGVSIALETRYDEVVRCKMVTVMP